MYLANAFRRSASKNSEAFTGSALVGTGKLKQGWEGSYPGTPLGPKTPHTPMLLDHTGCLTLSQTHEYSEKREASERLGSEQGFGADTSALNSGTETLPQEAAATPAGDHGRNPFDDDDVERVTLDIDESEIEAHKKVWDSRRAALANSGGRDPLDASARSALAASAGTPQRSLRHTLAPDVQDSILFMEPSPESVPGNHGNGSEVDFSRAEGSADFRKSAAKPAVVTNLSSTFEEEAHHPRELSVTPSLRSEDVHQKLNQSSVHHFEGSALRPALSWDHIPSSIIRETIVSLETQMAQYQRELAAAQDVIGSLRKALCIEQTNRQSQAAKIAEMELQIRALEEETDRKSLRIACLEKDREEQEGVLERLREELVQTQRRNNAAHETEAYADILSKLRAVQEQLDLVQLERDLLEKRLNGHSFESTARKQNDSDVSTGKENIGNTSSRAVPAEAPSATPDVPSAQRTKPTPLRLTQKSPHEDAVAASASLERSVAKQHIQKFERIQTSSLLSAEQRNEKRVMRFTDWIGSVQEPSNYMNT